MFIEVMIEAYLGYVRDSIDQGVKLHGKEKLKGSGTRSEN
jgi:hypothetical protein